MAQAFPKSSNLCNILIPSWAQKGSHSNGILDLRGDHASFVATDTRGLRFWSGSDRVQALSWDAARVARQANRVGGPKLVVDVITAEHTSI
jgi:hypothetical protein